MENVGVGTLARIFPPVVESPILNFLLFVVPGLRGEYICSDILKQIMEMKGRLLIGLFFIQTLFIFGQSRILTSDDYNKSGAIKLTFVTTTTEAIESAKYDIEKGTSFIFLKSGIAPVVYPTDSVFENKFKVYYYEQGCVGPDNELMEEYNYVIFNFLADRYGKKWEREIRKDAIGLRQWKRKKQ